MKREELLKVAKPILFNTEMVQAIMDGRKTVTRRVIKPQPKKTLWYSIAGYGHGKWYEEYNIKGRLWTPPYHADDILYVRETWCKGRIDCGEEPDGREALYISQCTGEDDYILKEYAISRDIGMEDVKWKPSIHMPKYAARIFLKVKRVKVERLQEISEEQALAEGVPDDWPMNKVYCPKCNGYGLVGAFSSNLGFMEIECSACEKATQRFKNLWDSTIKKQDMDQYGWDANPYVWVIEFERIEVE